MPADDNGDRSIRNEKQQEAKMFSLKRALHATAAALAALAITGGAHVASAAEPLKVVMSSTPSFTWLPFLVAEKVTFPDLEKKLGRKVAVTYAPTPSPAVLALLAGEQDLGIIYVQHAIKAQAEGKDLVVLAKLMQNPTMALLARTDLPEIKSPADIKGRVFGVVGLGSGHHLVGLGIAKAYSVNPNDVTWRSTGGVSGWIPAMRSKRVDVMLASEPTVSTLLAEGVGRVLIDLHTKEATQRVFKGSFPTVAVLARKSYVDRNPEVVRAFVKANLDALKWVHAHTPAEIAKVLPDSLKNRPDAEKVLARVVPAVSEDGDVPLESVTLTIDLMKEIGELPKDLKLDPAKIIDTRFLKP
jgi:NitT/TauT family transport system substrate-binding protein